MERLTKQRQAVLSFLRETETHPTADEVYRQVRHRLPRISLATVYRTLDTLVAEGLAWRVPGSQPARFEGHNDGHVHFVCRHCGTVIDLFPQKTPVDLTGLTDDVAIENYELLLKGLCPRCKAESPDKEN